MIAPQSQADPKFRTVFLYTKVTAKSLLNSLVKNKGYKHKDLPCENTIMAIVNRLGFKLKRVQKTKPLKKIAETDKIFDNVHTQNKLSDNAPNSLRISIDTKAKLKIGDFSRNGLYRGTEARKGLDHDFDVEDKLVPFGILEVLSGKLNVVYGVSYETSDFIVDCLLEWWKKSKNKYSNIKELVINIDNGPQNSSTRSQFLKRMIAFSDKTGLKIRLIYYPPYHSKYNPIERCWAILEQHWNGELLNKISKIINWTKTMTWKGIKPMVLILEKTYDKGVKLATDELLELKKRIIFSKTLPKWDLTILPI